MQNKKIYDPIHKYMLFEPILLKIIDTQEFQRLRFIKQLGFCYYVFSGASHNRFEHSLGVAHLSGLLLKKLQNKQPELKITDRLILLVKIAGLVHDIGHCCFSHFFDNYFLKKKLKTSKMINHEYRSQIIFEYMVSKYKLEINTDEVLFIKNLIDPTEKDNNFIYQIVANKISCIDCDKFDYLLRDTYNIGLPYTFECDRFIDNTKVIDNIICYSDKLIYDIYDLFNLRFRLHKQIYNHHTVNQIENMMLDVLLLVDEYFNISESVLEIENFLKLDDHIFETILYSNIDNNNIKKAKQIIKNVKNRILYKLEEEIILDSCDIPNNILKKYNYFNDNNYCKSLNIINYSKDNCNPLNFINLYNENNKRFIFDTKKIKICPVQFQEIILRIFKK